MANNCHLENAPCLMAAVELNASCQIVAAAPVYTSEGMITFTPEIESEDGVDYSRLNWAGKRIGPATTGERAEKWWNLTGEIATKDWALFGMLTGNPVVLDGDGNVVGYERPMQRGGVGCGTERKPRAALVIVTAAGISDAGCTVPESGATECVGQFWPLTTSWNIDLAEKSADAPTIKFDAKAFGSPNQNAGVLNLWPSDAVPAFISANSAVSEAFVTCSALPAIDCDATLAHPAPRVPAP
ncbi:MAG: hypothetical protein IPH81_17765 [Candidatus Microthrix sp.]|nr:hypothetical protein [Candidatus Microthrix sp.]